MSPRTGRGRGAFGDRPHVAVLGGGVGGLSAAQKLAERGFPVTVYEARERFGGKARSIPGPDRGAGPPLPGEHGFRFFPGFYRHLPDAMARIPDGEGSVADNLVAASGMMLARTGQPAREIGIDTPRSVGEWRTAMENVFAGQDVPADESAFFVNRLLYLLTTCRERREDELEDTTWWEFIEAERMSPAYRTFLGDGLTRMLVAMRPQVSSARTIGRVYLQLFRGRLDPSIEADRVLDAPSNEAWIDPWVRYLEDLGVELHADTAVTRLHADGRRITGAELDDGSEVDADYYVLAVPVEVADRLATEAVCRTAPSLRGLSELETGWMNGVQFYLSEPVGTVHGHGVYYDSPWALTSIAQGQFWPDYDLDARADGSVEDVLSVCVSDWDTPGILYGKPARECSPEEIQEEVWAQLQDHLGEDTLPDAHLVDWFLDPEIRFEDGTVANDAPLLINTVGSLRHRPDAGTEAENLVLAADYVRTHTDLASMEAANEAARRAVNEIIDREGIRSERCGVWDFEEPAVFRPAKRQDQIRYRLGLPHPGEAATPIWRTYDRIRGGASDLTALFD
ncbi:phytoene dehydrogenase [Halobacteriales archaeon QS_8_69_26]|nr:MAG: phytoene dehydrogenase [Halobacteriales archaeon QS_8_69_26]